MRELSISELNIVSGGEYSRGDLIATGAALGGGVGLSLAAQFGLPAAEALLVAGIFSTASGAVTATGIAAYAIGEGLNEHTPLQSWIADMIDKLNSTFDGDEM